jgi:hypothetical protein
VVKYFMPRFTPQIGTLEADDVYVATRLAWVRQHIAKLDRAIERETNARQLNLLTLVQNRLSEQERKLAGRPLPGSLRPKAYDFGITRFPPN